MSEPPTPHETQPEGAPTQTAPPLGLDDEAARAQPPAPPPARARLLRILRRTVAPAIALVMAFVLGTCFGDETGQGDKQQANDAAAAEAKQPTQWTCSMHPQIKLPDPGQCPICGMDLIPLEETSGEELAPNQVAVSERAKALARIETTPVRVADTSVEMRLLGRLEYDETAVRTITTWTDGRIDRLLVSTVGEKVKRGQMIATLYSPEVYAAQVDYVQAKLQLDRLKDALPVARHASKAALDSAATRLRLLGVKPRSADKIDENTTPAQHVGVTAHYAGTVVMQMVNEGAYVKAGTPIFKVADLSTIWAQLDAYEGDLGRIRKGQRVVLEISSFPGEKFEGKVAFIDPIVDPRTRTAQIRVVVPNEDGKLSPGMFADALLASDDDAASRLTIPATAPLFTGKRSVVYVELPDRDRPTYEARVVDLGPRAGDVYPVLAGLKAGEQVVVHGAFTLDADLQIRGGASVMTPKFMQGLARVMEAYLDLHDRLAADDLPGSKAAFATLGEQAAGFDPRTPEEARKIYEKAASKIAGEARQAAKSDDIESMRRRYATISEQMILAAIRFGNPSESTVRLAFCPMARDGEGAHWLQRAEAVENPFFGAKMYTCGEVRGTVAQGERLPPHAGHAEGPSPAPAPAGHQH
jgi:Cu(I)/Ag(I) efflux system membrane fusion protein